MWGDHLDRAEGLKSPLMGSIMRAIESFDSAVALPKLYIVTVD
jgi:hypothetical protein